MSHLSITNGSAGGVGLRSTTGAGYTSKGGSLVLHSFYSVNESVLHLILTFYASVVNSSAGNTTPGGVGLSVQSAASSTVAKSTGLPAAFNTGGYGTPPHLRRKSPGSVAGSDTSTNTSTFAKVKAVSFHVLYNIREVIIDEIHRCRRRSRWTPPIACARRKHVRRMILPM